MKQTENIKT